MCIGRETVSLPLSAKLSDQDVEDVIAAVSRLLKISTGKTIRKLSLSNLQPIQSL
jgi:hypothetical protein